MIFRIADEPYVYLSIVEPNTYGEGFERRLK